VKRLGELLRSPEQERLAAALEDLTQPHLRLKDVRDDIAQLLKEGRGNEAQASYVAYRAAALYPEAGTDGRGKLLQDWAKAWGPKFDGLCGKDGAKLKQAPPTTAPSARRSTSCSLRPGTSTRAGGCVAGASTVR